uniref:Protein containing THAP domain n=1 Tax=Rhipicephalus zambeziensis TaxID=60191 RepID=A0A224YQ26_9ACAR
MQRYVTMSPHRRSSGGCTERRAKPIPRRICAVPGCSTNNTRNLPSPVSFHQFPPQNERREMWMKALGIQSGTHRRVCALHFHEDAFERRRDAAAYAGIRRHLRCDAIPMCCTTAPALGAEHGPQDSQDNAATSSAAPALGADHGPQDSQANITLHNSEVAFVQEIAANVEIGPLPALETDVTYSTSQNNAQLCSSADGISFVAETVVLFLCHHEQLPKSGSYNSDHDYCSKHHTATQTDEARGEKKQSKGMQTAICVKALKCQGTQTD